MAYVIVLRDVLLEKKLQRERGLQQIMQVMYASVSHELRTPINAIINCIRCLKVSSTDRQKKWLDIAWTSSELLLSLVNDTLDFT